MEQDVVIAVMGMTGVGKSSFIKNVTRCPEIAIGHGLTSETSEVKSYSFIRDGKRITLVDTPGFNDTFESDQIITERILTWLGLSYREGAKLNGILYLHSIAQPKMPGTAFDNLCMFRKLCGRNALGSVVLGTTFWCHAQSAVGERRESELKEDDQLWGRMVKAGSRVVRLENTAESAMAVLAEVSRGSKVVLQAQSEMVEEGKTLHQTSASLFVASLGSNVQRRLYTAEVGKLNDMHDRMKTQEEHLESINKEVEKERLKLERSRKKYYASHKCRCRLVGRPKCAGCGRNIRRAFYHCCFCGYKAFLHCVKCGHRCENDDHPDMDLQNTYCNVM